MAAGDLGELLVPYMPTIRVPKSGDRVYKTECAFSYDSPVSAAKPPPAASAPPPRRGLPTCPQPAPCGKPAPPAAPSPLHPPLRGQPLALSPGRHLPLRLQNLPSPPPPDPSLPLPARLLPPAVASSAARFPLALPARAAVPPPPRVGVAAGLGPTLPRAPALRDRCAVRCGRGSSRQIAAASYAVAVLVRSFI